MPSTRCGWSSPPTTTRRPSASTATSSGSRNGRRSRRPTAGSSILEAGRATLEIADPGQAAFIDEVEVGRRVAGHIRVAFEVDDSRAMTALLAAGGATVIAEATRTPWETENARLEGPGGLQLTLFSDAPPAT